MKIKELIPAQPYFGCPEQLPDMVKSILAGEKRRGGKIQLLKTPKGVYIYDGHCWCSAVFLAEQQGGRDFLYPEEYDLYELGGKPCSVTLEIKGLPVRYDWDGAGFLSKNGRGYNIYSMEKIRVDGKREYAKKTVQSLKELSSKYTT